MLQDKKYQIASAVAKRYCVPVNSINDGKRKNINAVKARYAFVRIIKKLYPDSPADQIAEIINCHRTLVTRVTRFKRLGKSLRPTEDDLEFERSIEKLARKQDEGVEPAGPLVGSEPCMVLKVVASHRLGCYVWDGRNSKITKRDLPVGSFVLLHKDGIIKEIDDKDINNYYHLMDKRLL